MLFVVGGAGDGGGNGDPEVNPNISIPETPVPDSGTTLQPWPPISLQMPPIRPSIGW